MTREEAEKELLAYKNTKDAYYAHKWSNEYYSKAYNKCNGSVRDTDTKERWNKLVDIFYHEYIKIASPLGKLLAELDNED